MKARRAAILIFGMTIPLGGIAHATTVSLTGPTSNAGTYSTAQLAAFGAANSGDVVNAGGLTGVSLWGLLGTVTTSTPPGDNGKNAILRYYVAAGITGPGGGQSVASVVSLGQIDPNFGGTTAPPPFVAYKNNGVLLGAPELVVPGVPSGSTTTVANLATLRLLSAPALPSGPPASPGGPSTTVTLSGPATNPGSYTLQNLMSLTPVTQQTVPTGSGTTTYTGISLSAFIQPTNPNINGEIVIGKATDGYEVVYALAELTNLNYILAYASSAAGEFPGAGVARTILPGDNRHGRWISNLYALEVAPAVTPLPASWVFMLTGLAGLGFAAHRRGRRERGAAAGV